MTNWKVFENLPDAVLPDLPACYVVYLDGKLTYIGHTSNLRKRLYGGHQINFARYSHTIDTPWGFADSVRVKAHFGTRYGEWAMRELRLIHKLRPPANCVGSTKKRRTSCA